MKLYEAHGMTLEEFRRDISDRLSRDESAPKIARLYGVSPPAIYAWMKKFNISRRVELRSAEWLREQYVDHEKSAEEIAVQLGVSAPAVIWHLSRTGIRRRTRSEAQRIANHKRLVSPLHQHGSHRSRGFCFRYRGLYCRSIPELMWLLGHDRDFDRIQWEPFVFENKRPDALLDGVVYEIKATQSSMDQSALDRYVTLGNQIKDQLGYDYKLVFMRDLYPNHYHALLAEAKKRGAKRGQEGPAILWS